MFKTSQASNVGSIPIARSISHDDSTGLTRLTYPKIGQKRIVLDPTWTLAVR